MKITAVTTAVVRANFDDTCVRVHTDEGIYGTGECFPASRNSGNHQCGSRHQT